jgi:hypothetical protein
LVSIRWLFLYFGKRAVRWCSYNHADGRGVGFFGNRE